MTFSKLSTALCVLAITGCSNVPGTAVSPDARPGPDLIPPSFAGNFFTEICLTTAPSFADVPKAIAGEPFVQHQVTGTYYHQFADLSIKVHDYGCSLVFKSDQSIDETLSGLAQGVAKNAANWGVTIPRNLDISSRPSPQQDGRYFRIGLPRGN